MQTNLVFLAFLISVIREYCVCDDFYDYNDYYNDEDYDQSDLERLYGSMYNLPSDASVPDPVEVDSTSTIRNEGDDALVVKEDTFVVVSAFENTLGKESGEGNPAIADPLLGVMDEYEQLAKKRKQSVLVSSTTHRSEVYNRLRVSPAAATRTSSSVLWLVLVISAPGNYLIRGDFYDYNDYYGNVVYDDYDEDDDLLTLLSNDSLTVDEVMQYLRSSTVSPLLWPGRNQKMNEEVQQVIVKEGDVLLGAFENTMEKESGEGNPAIDDPLLGLLKEYEELAKERKNKSVSVIYTTQRPGGYARQTKSMATRTISTVLWLGTSCLVLFFTI